MVRTPCSRFFWGRVLGILVLWFGITASDRAADVVGEDWISDREYQSCESGSACGFASSLTFSANVLFLDRGTPDSLVMMQDTTDPSRNLNADDFHFGWRAGWEFSLARELGSGEHVEARYMSLDAWKALASATTNSTLLDPLRINTNPPTFAPAVQTIRATYGSDLRSLEINYESEMTSSCSWFAGFRYIGLDEHLHSDLNAVGQVFTYDISTRNRMYGFQTGAESAICIGETWTLGATVSAGVYHNSAGHTSILNTNVITQSASGTSDRAAFAGELRFSATHQLTDQLAVRFGYDLLWLETVALAGDQIPATNLFAGTGVAADGGVLFQGAFVGLQYRH